MMDLHQMSAAARKAFYTLAVSDHDIRNRALIRMSDLLKLNKEEVFHANSEDLRQAEQDGLSSPLLHRLKFGEEKLHQVCDGLVALTSLRDPIGRCTLATEITDGLILRRITCPIGVIGVIFESRPDALIQIASLCIKSGNAVLLKGGREAVRTNRILSEIVRKALSDLHLPPDAAQLLESRDDVAAMLKEDQLIDLIIPRGSNAFVRYIMDNSNIPVLGHSDGICHVYIDKYADMEKALSVSIDSKVQNVSVCNAMETLLIHQERARDLLPALAEKLRENHVEIRGDQNVMKIIECKPATEEDWATEYLDYVLSIHIVESLDEAIEHINHYGSHHTDCIITEDDAAAREFMNKVDSAGVYRNVSTRFADGFVYGFGAEVGIATGKLHARGPMGLDGLTTYKYELSGNGHTLAEMKNGTRRFTHKSLPLTESLNSEYHE